MGLIRLFLAIAVVLAHNGIQVAGIDGSLSVSAFFIISGFYMALVLNEKYQDNIAGFYGARFLRLWPSYIIVFGAVLIFIAPMTPSIYASTGAAIATWASAITMFFYNVLWWFGVDAATGKIVFYAAQRVSTDGPAFVNATHMEHMWSVGIEITFYIVAPFLARKPKAILISLGMAFLLHLAIMSDLYPLFPLQGRSATNFFWLFLLGMAAYWASVEFNPTISKVKLNPQWISLAGVVLTAFVIAGLQKYDRNQYISAGLFVIFATSLILVFQATRLSRIDQAIGNLSYPIYLVHWPIVSILIINHRSSWMWSLLIAGISLVCAAILYFCVDQQVEKFRRRLANRTIYTTAVGTKSATIH